MAGQPKPDNEADELLRGLLAARLLGVENSWDEVFEWWPGHPTGYKYSPDFILAFDPSVQGWVPLWCPVHHWEEADGQGRLRPISEKGASGVPLPLRSLGSKRLLGLEERGVF